MENEQLGLLLAKSTIEKIRNYERTNYELAK